VLRSIAAKRSVGGSSPDIERTEKKTGKQVQNQYSAGDMWHVCTGHIQLIVCLYVCGSRENVTKINTLLFFPSTNKMRRSQWPRGLRRELAAPRDLGFWVRILPRTWMSVSCKCCVFSGRGFCDELITRPEES
jgi:hypothetical protein